MLKNPIVIANLRDNISSLNEIKNLLKNTEKEYKSLMKIKDKSLKRKPVKKPLDFYLGIPNLFISAIQDFIKESKNFKNIKVGAQNFDSVEKQNINNNITLPQIKNIGSKFVLLNSNFYLTEDKLENNNSLRLTKDNKSSDSAHNIIIDRLNAVSKKFKDRENLNQDINKEKENILDINSKFLENKKKNNRELQNIKDKLNASLNYKLPTILIINSENDDSQFLINLIKNLIKESNYNLFSNLMICYKDTDNLGILDIENCQEKAISIRRTIANLFGIDNAKKVKILYEGEVNDTNILKLLDQGGINGILLSEESLKPKFLAKILTAIS